MPEDCVHLHSSHIALAFCRHLAASTLDLYSILILTSIWQDRNACLFVALSTGAAALDVRTDSACKAHPLKDDDLKPRPLRPQLRL